MNGEIYRHSGAIGALTRRAMLGSLGGSAVLLLSGCGQLFPHKFRLRMTAEVQTPEGLKTGSSVYEVIATKLHAFTSEEAQRSAGAFGEAVVVDLPDGPLFILLRTAEGSTHTDLAQLSMATLDKKYQNDWVESARRIAERWSTLRGEVPREEWPIMVRFRDTNDPTTVKQVDPAAVGVTRVRMETTKDDVTRGIQARLPWLDRIDGSLISRLSVADPTNPPFAARIHSGDFRWSHR